MKKTILLILVFISINTFAQKIELTGFYGYNLNGKLKTYSGNYNVNDAPNFGGNLGIELYKGGFVELMYNRSDTRFTYTRSGIIGGAPIDMAVEYYQIGTIKQFEAHDIVKPFGGFTVGMVRFHPKQSYDWDGDGTPSSLSDSWRFGATLGAGLKIYLSDKLGIRLQARLLMPMEFNGIFIGIGGGGAGGGASFRVPLLSGDFTGGLILRLGK